MTGETPEQVETFESFKKSFFYGSRSDMSFKFLAHLPDDQAAVFFQGLLATLVDAYDHSDPAPVFEHIRQGQISSYAQEARAVFNSGPFCPMNTPLSQSRLMLLTSSGHFVQGDDPQPLGMANMTQTQAERQIMSFLKEAPTLSAIPVDTPVDRLMVRHGGYDVRGARRDPEVTLPLKRLQELSADGCFAELADPVYSFVGACSQTRIKEIDGPEWVTRFKSQQIDAALLVPVWPVCHVSVGHVARLMESAGIPTVVLAVAAFEEPLKKMMLPRVLLTPYLLGRPVGPVGDAQTQRDVVKAALNLLEAAPEPTMTHYPSPWGLPICKGKRPNPG